MKKPVLYTEAAYGLGMVGLSFSVALMTRADFGVSMVVAPAYLLYLKLNPLFPFFTFGMAEYTLQAALLLFTVLAVRKFRPYFLFSGRVDAPGRAFPGGELAPADPLVCAGHFAGRRQHRLFLSDLYRPGGL